MAHARDCVDALICHMRTLGVDINICQLDQATTSCSLHALASANTRAMHFSVGSQLHHLLGSESGYCTFGLLTGPQIPSRIRERRFSHRQLLQIDPETGLDAVIEPGFSAYTFSIREQHLLALAEQEGLRGMATLLAGAGTEKAAPLTYLADIRRAVTKAFNTGLADPSDAASDEFFEYELPLMLMRTWLAAGPDNAQHVRASTRARARQRAVAYIREQGAGIGSVEVAEVVDAALARLADQRSTASSSS